MTDRDTARARAGREEAMRSFFPVSPLMIFPDAMGTFSVFLKQDRELVLYTSSGERFTEAHRRKLHESGVEHVYIQTVEKPNFDEYVEENLGRILDNEALPLSDRSRVFTKATQAVLSETFEEKMPRTLAKGSFRRIGHIVRQSLGFLSDERSLKALAPFIAHDYRTYTHSMHVFVFTVSILNTFDLGEDELYETGLGAILHDIGKTRIPSAILNKKGALTQQERAVMEAHPLQGVALTASLDVSQTTFNCILFHHERMDGEGYPSGIRAEDIPLPVRALALADAYDLLTTNRPGSEGATPFEALNIIRYEMEGAFDMDIYRRFVEVLAGAEMT